MKEQYETAELHIVSFESDDIIAQPCRNAWLLLFR